MRLSDYLFQELLRVGVNTVYTVTGRGALFLTDALAKTNAIRAVCTHHEQSAAFAAAAEAQLTNKLAVCLVSTGCAATNAITGVLNAWQDSLPVLFISGQNILQETTYHTKSGVRTYGQQEANIVEIVKPITKHATMITKAQDIRCELERAVYEASNGRKGPVWIDIPLDLQSAQLDPSQLNPFKELKAEIKASSTDIDYLTKCLSEAKRPLVLVGSGIRAAEQVAVLADFLATNRLPAVYTPSGADALPLSSDQTVGSVGSMGCSRAGSFAVQNSDLLLVLGSRLSSQTVGPDSCKFARHAKVIVVDIDRIEHQKNTVRIDKFIHADLCSFIGQLGISKITGDINEWIKTCQRWKQIFKEEKVFTKGGPNEKIDLHQLSATLTKLLPRDAVVITDSGFIEVIVPSHVEFIAERRAIHPSSQGSMGFALPAVLGAAGAGNPIFVVVGDGSIMMNIQELETIRAQNIPVKIIVVNNNAYAIIRRRQRELFRNRTIGTDPSNGVSIPKFEKIADTFGLQYTRINDNSELEDGLRRLIDSSGPTICEIMGRDDQEYLEIAYCRTEEGKYVRRPLEDQYPFLDREIFLKEMRVPPIDQ